MRKFALALLVLVSVVSVAEAGPFGRGRLRRQPTYTQTQQSLTYTPTPAGPQIEYQSTTETFTGPIGLAGDGLDEVNAKRAARGLRPFIRDEGLTKAAFATANFRAQNLMFGHTSNDFAFVPAGASAASAGCAAYPASYGWMSCCTYEGYTYAGAAWVTGRDGKRYMHLFVR